MLLKLMTFDSIRGHFRGNFRFSLDVAKLAYFSLGSAL